MENTSTKILKASARRGMTLIEILVVVAILGMLATAVTVTVLDQFEDAKGERARMDIAAVTQGLSAYYIKMGKYPTTGEGLSSLVSPPKGSPLLSEIPKDPWENEYNYAYPGTRNAKGFDLWSSGKDGQSGSEDDIGNWKDSSE
jgi:general secretion pathway protein G